MKYRRLGRTDIDVSLICLGTMMWGTQNSEAEAHAQLDYAVDHGVNFFDTAEIYPMPPTADTQGRSEEIVGRWMKARGNRDKMIVATKVAGMGFDYIRGAPARLNADHINRAVDASLRRLQTHVIDLYQVHHPGRQTNRFGVLNFRYDPADTDWEPLEETWDAMAALVKAGKVRHLGISNETPWGLMGYLRASDTGGLPRPAAIQNCYSLINRMFDIGLSEMAIREGVGLLAYSPMGMGLLSGKFAGGARPAGTRLVRYERFNRYLIPKGQQAADRYCALARQNGLDPAQMALAFVNSRPFVTSSISGATSIEQLAANIAAVDLVLPREVLDAIEAIHLDIPNPCP